MPKKTITTQKICFFSSYFSTNKVTDTTLYYLKELSENFDLVIVASNKLIPLYLIKKKLSSQKIKTLWVKNEGYDFGMYYKIFKKYNFTNIKTLCLANDSSVLINPLSEIINRFENSEFDYFGNTSSNEIKYHVQSYFVLLKEKAIKLLFEYLKQKKIQKNYFDVILTYELGITELFLNNGLKTSSFFIPEIDFLKNPTYFKTAELILNHAPLIKKNILTNKFRHGAKDDLERQNFKFTPDYYKKLINENCLNNEILAASICNSSQL